DPAATRAAIEAAAFVVALELRETDVTRMADVVFPVAPVTDKAGTFVNWEGRPRTFEAILANPASLPDLRVLAGISEELHAIGAGAPLGFRTVAEVRAEMADLGPWDGQRPAAPAVAAAPSSTPAGDGLILSTWKQLLDGGTMQHGDKYLAATARPTAAGVSRTVFEAVGPTVTVAGDRGSVTLPAVVVDDLVDGVVWLPANSFGRGVLADVASPGTRVTVKGGTS
ncbi:MAG: NADH-quinone oxidoreductase subunit G, partial [Nocardioides sp.]|nr:NADH-quinone oxidoreductase subunit G [Nocardioides sp.]